MRIAVTDTLGAEHKFMRYIEWLARDGTRVATVTLSYRTDNASELESCDALVLTGGHDVNPMLYNGPQGHSEIADVDPRRDEFEYKTLDGALARELPVLGICRGLQLANVYFGGTLIPDIEEAGYSSHRSKNDSVERRHEIAVEPESLLKRITGMQRGIVNTSHHQAAFAVGKGLRITARSEDGIIEALEFETGRYTSFFLLVQWHPERIIDFENPFSRNLLHKFLSSIRVEERLHER